MSKWFGVGFSFMAEDKGVKDSFRKVRDELKKTDESLDDVKKKSDDGKESLLSWANIAKIGFLQKINNGLNSLNETIGQVSESDRNFVALESVLKNFEGLGQIKGDGAKQFMKDFRDMSSQFGTDQSALTEYIIGLQKAGFSFDEIAQRIPSASKAMGIFNQTADSAVGFDKMSKRMKLSALQAEKLKQQVLSVGIATGDNEILNNLDEIQKAVAESTTFKNLSGEEAKKTILGMVKAQSLVRNTMKMTSEESAGFVTNIFEKIKGTEEQFAQLRAGAGGGTDEFKELALAVGDSGKAMKLLESNNIVGIIGALQQSMAGLSKQEQEAKLVRLKGIFGPQMAELMTKNLNKAGKAIQDNLVNENAIQSEKTLTDLGKQKIANLEKFEKLKRESLGFKQQEIETKRNNYNMEQGEKMNHIKLRAIKMEEELMEKKRTASDLSIMGFAREFENLNKLGTTQEKILKILDFFGADISSSGGGVDIFSDAIDLLTGNILELGVAYNVLKAPVRWFGKVTGITEKIVKTYDKTIGFLGKGVKFLMKPFTTLGRIMKLAFSKPASAIKIAGNLIKNGIGFITNGAKTAMAFLSKMGSGVSKAFGFLGKFAPALKVGGALLAKLALPIGVIIALVDTLTSHWDRLVETFSNGDWGDFAIEVLDTLSDGINSFFLGIPQAIAGALQGLWDGVFEDGSFWDNFKSAFAEGAKDIPFIGEKIYNSLMGGGKGKDGIPKDEMTNIKTSDTTMAHASPTGSPTPLMTRGIINNSTTNNNNGNGAFDMDALANVFGNVEQTIILKDTKGNVLGKTKSRLNGHSTATSS